MAKRALVVESEPSEVFAPVKNAEGSATDTPTSVKQSISKLHRRWLENAGATVADNVKVEIHPNWALDPQDVANRVTSELHVLSDTYFH